MDDLCKHCGKPESEHHAFVKLWPAPKGCQCARTWSRTIPAICAQYIAPFTSEDHCVVCHHDHACHAPKD